MLSGFTNVRMREKGEKLKIIYHFDGLKNKVNLPSFISFPIFFCHDKHHDQM